MAEMKHTAGPWHVGVGNGKGSVFGPEDCGRMRLESGGTTLYPIATVNHGWRESEDNANAALIAAAPDNYRVTRLLNAWAIVGASSISFSTLMPDSDTETLGEAVIAAIAKATK